MKNKIFGILLFVSILVLLANTLYLQTLSSYAKVEVVVKGYDPKDLLSGYYLNFAPDWEKTNCAQFVNNVCPKNDFDSNYVFYINQSMSEKLTKAVDGNVIKLVFSYNTISQPIIVDMLVDGISYKEYIENLKN